MAEREQQQHTTGDGSPPSKGASSSSLVKPQLTTSTLKQLGRKDDDEQPPVSPIMSRRTSFESDRFSTVSGLTSYFPNNPKNVNPAPVYVAPVGASQVVSEHLSSLRRPTSDDEEDGGGELNKNDVTFNESALALVNTFLDQLLYSFLSTARSTSLLALRPAVSEVLKARLAKDAIASAQEELEELLAGGEDDDGDDRQRNSEDNRHWDLELVWKRTRLRVMVYMRLGEMEDDDEERYIKEEELFHGNERRFSRSSGLVSWAAAIFLTSVLEYVAEHTLRAAGQAAYTRARRESRTQHPLSSVAPQKADVLKVDEFDVEKVALHSTLGRLWRTWRKTLRNNNSPSSPTQRTSTSFNRVSRDNMVSAMSHRRSSFGTAQESSVMNESRPTSRDQKEELGDIEHPEHVIAANMSLPMGDATKDIDEIVIPGLLADPDEDDTYAARDNEPYPHTLLGSLVALPLLTEKRDVDEIELPGLARDPEAPGADAKGVRPEPGTATRRYSVGDWLPHRTSAVSVAPEDSEAVSSHGAISSATRLRAMSLPIPARLPESSDVLSVADLKLEGDDTTEAAPKDGSPELTSVDQLDFVHPMKAAHDEDDAGAREEHMVSETAKKEVSGVQGETVQASQAMQGSDKHGEEDNGLDGLTSSKRDNEFPWMVAGAGAATVTGVAGVATAGTWASNSKDIPQESTAGSLEDTGAPQSGSRSPNTRASPIAAANGKAMNEEETRSHESIANTKPGASQRSYSDDEVAELDRRKSLIDIKAMMVVNGPSGPTSPEGEELPSEMDRDVGRESQLDAEHIGGVSEEEGFDDSIGVARTSDVQSTLTAGMSARQQAREPPKPSTLIIDTMSPRQELDSPTITQPASPRTMERQFLDLTTDTDQTDQSARAAKSSYRASLANGAQQSAALENSLHRASLTAAMEKDSVALHRKSSSTKTTEPKSPKVAKSPRLVSNPDAMKALTSASIRGPEDFDMFVQGAGTAKYTLTPDAVRDGPVGTSAQRNQAPVEMDANSVYSKPDSRSGRSVTSKQATSAQSVGGAEEKSSKASRRRSAIKPPPRNVSSHGRSGWMAREPRVQTESTRDFADFIRSTGPDKDATVVPLLANASQTSLHNLRSAHIHGASASRSSSPNGERTKSLTHSLHGTAVPPVPPVPSRSKSTMQPRGANAASLGSADLIDFIRSGPDEEGQRRIPRTVAPFRSTMDSDQFRDFTDRSSGERVSDVRGYPNSMSAQSQSIRSSQTTSVNSRSALLNNGASNVNRTSQPAYSGTTQRLTLAETYTPSAAAAYGIPEPTYIPGAEPARKSVKSKDPYSIDFLDDDDDDDDEMLADTLGRPSRKEESLVDFLNSTEPPRNNAPQAIIDPNSPSAISALSRMRTGSNLSQNPTSPLGGSLRTRTNGSSIRSGQPSPAPAMPRLQARGGQREIAAHNNTRELADFLKNSGPDDADSAPAPSVGRGATRTKEEKMRKKSFGSGLFSRGSKKKTYLDMP